MSRFGGDDGDYVLVYDGEHGVKMMPRALAAAFEQQDPADISPTVPEASAATASASRRRKPAAVVGGVLGVCLLGMGLGLYWPAGDPEFRLADRAAAIPGQADRGGELETHPPFSSAEAGPQPHPQERGRATAQRPPHPRRRVPARMAWARAAAIRCRGLHSPADRMVCRDPGLAARDARLARALRSAAEAGAPAEDLRDGQAAWRAERDAAAARRSRAEVAAAYDRRLEELEARRSAYPPPD